MAADLKTVLDRHAGRFGDDRPRERMTAIIVLDKPKRFSDISVMTEISENNDLTPTMERYILHWGEMGARWGVNRSVSQVHALLYLSEHPLSAEEIADILGIARSNVSTSLKELLSWKLVHRTHVLGDRRDHFSAETDLWAMLMLIVEGRKGREIDPTLNVLRQCVAEGKNDARMPPVALARISEMLSFMDMLTGWYGQVSRLPRPVLIKLLKLGNRIAKYVGKK